MSKELACAAIIIALEGDTVKVKRKRKAWMKEWLKKRPRFSHETPLKELVMSSPEDFKNFLRMDNETFSELLGLVTPYIAKQDTNMRDAIPPCQRLSSTLRFLATGQTFEELKFTTCISAQSLGKIILETCSAVIKVLKDNIKMPQSEEEWIKVAESFQNLWNFPQCMGAIDGKHIEITKPPGSGSSYFNYKHSFSIVLMALVNSNYEFMMVNVGTNGRVSDGEVSANTKLSKQLKEKALHIPEPRALPDSNVVVPYVFVGDDAFPLMDNFMKPYAHRHLSKEEIFNFRLSRAHRIVENAFSILVSRFRIIQNAINLCPEKVSVIVLACCYLHNYLCQKNRTLYLEGTEDENARVMGEGGKQLFSLEPMNVQNASSTAKEVRNRYCHYFNNVGAVPWQ